jgi:hypothetical protein
MTDLNPTASTYNKPFSRIAVTFRAPMTNTGPLFSTLDMVAGILAVVMTLGPLAMAAFAVGRY